MLVSVFLLNYNSPKKNMLFPTRFLTAQDRTLSKTCKNYIDVPKICPPNPQAARNNATNLNLQLQPQNSNPKP